VTSPFLGETEGLVERLPIGGRCQLLWPWVPLEPCHSLGPWPTDNVNHVCRSAGNYRPSNNRIIQTSHSHGPADYPGNYSVGWTSILLDRL